MLLDKVKGRNAFKAMGTVVGCFREMFKNKQLAEIAKAKEKGWILDFFSISLDECSDIWVTMFLTLNPEINEEDITIPAVIHFAMDIKNDPELMSLFFSQSEQTDRTSSGSPMENIEETEVTPIHS